MVGGFASEFLYSYYIRKIAIKSRLSTLLLKFSAVLQKGSPFMNTNFNISLFNNKLDNTAKPQSLDWQALSKLLTTPDIRNDKDGRLISGATFTDNRRNKKNAIESSLLNLDFDHVETIDLLWLNQLAISYAFYTTFSHGTKEKPCAYRVIIPLNKPIPADKYPFLFKWALDITQGKIDPACKDISRMQYLPACPNDRKHLFQHGSNIGTLLDWQNVIKSLDKPDLSTQTPNAIPTQARAKTKPQKQNYGDFEQYVSQIQETEISSVANAANGSRNVALNKAAFALGTLAGSSWANVNQNEIETRLFDAANACGLVKDKGESATRATIKSGLENGLLQPRPLPENKPNWQNVATGKTIAKKDKSSNHYQLNMPLPISEFMHVANEKPQCTLDNLNIILRCYGFHVRYNVITKREETTLNSKAFIGADADNIAISKITSACIINKMSVTHIPTYLIDIAYENSYNPITEWIESKAWDGESRLKDLEETIETTPDFNQELLSLLLRKWLISAAAAAYNLNGDFRSKGVLVFQGEQSVGKTAWLKQLVPNEIKNLIKDGVSLDVTNKDSILKVISHWLVELGELDATFKKSEIAQLKSFITEDKDVVRRPYAKKESYYPRQTVFCASVNDQDFLKDSTGNVRFWVIPVKYLDYEHGIDMQQVWAEAAHYFKTGEQWWLTREQEKSLETSNAKFTEENRFAGRLMSRLNQNTSKTYRLTTDEALRLCGVLNPQKQDIREMNQLLRSLGFEEKNSGGRYFLSHHVIADF